MLEKIQIALHFHICMHLLHHFIFIFFKKYLTIQKSKSSIMMAIFFLLCCLTGVQPTVNLAKAWGTFTPTKVITRPSVLTIIPCVQTVVSQTWRIMSIINCYMFVKLFKSNVGHTRTNIFIHAKIWIMKLHVKQSEKYCMHGAPLHTAAFRQRRKLKRYHVNWKSFACFKNSSRAYRQLSRKNVELLKSSKDISFELKSKLKHKK